MSDILEGLICLALIIVGIIAIRYMVDQIIDSDFWKEGDKEDDSPEPQSDEYSIDSSASITYGYKPQLQDKKANRSAYIPPISDPIFSETTNGDASVLETISDKDWYSSVKYLGDNVTIGSGYSSDSGSSSDFGNGGDFGGGGASGSWDSGSSDSGSSDSGSSSD